MMLYLHSIYCYGIIFQIIFFRKTAIYAEPIYFPFFNPLTRPFLNRLGRHFPGILERGPFPLPKKAMGSSFPLPESRRSGRSPKLAAFQALGNCLYKLNQNQAALDAFDKSLAIHPDNPTVKAFAEALRNQPRSPAAPSLPGPGSAPAAPGLPAAMDSPSSARQEAQSK